MVSSSGELERRSSTGIHQYSMHIHEDESRLVIEGGGSVWSPTYNNDLKAFFTHTRQHNDHINVRGIQETLMQRLYYEKW